MPRYACQTRADQRAAQAATAEQSVTHSGEENKIGLKWYYVRLRFAQEQSAGTGQIQPPQAEQATKGLTQRVNQESTRANLIREFVRSFSTPRIFLPS